MRKTKTADAGLEDFIDWTGVVEGEPIEEKEMFSLAFGFATRMRKRSATLEGEATSSYGEKRPRHSPSDERAQKEWVVVLVESPDQASND